MIKVTYPPGAGGAWLLTALKSLVEKYPWQNQPVNFHSDSLTPGSIGHNIDQSDQVLFIGGNNSRYNFWRIYCYKSFLHEPLVKAEYIDLPFDQSPEKFFWVLNQCRYIQSYTFNGPFAINWLDLWTNPVQVWHTIIDYFKHIKINCSATYEDFLIPLNNYLDTCRPVTMKTNIHHKLYRIWCLSWLQNNNYQAPFDVFEQFNSQVLTQWILQYHNDIKLYTTSTTSFQ